MVDTSRYTALAYIHRQISSFNNCTSFSDLQRTKEKIKRAIDASLIKKQIDHHSYGSLNYLLSRTYTFKKAELNKLAEGN